MVNKSALFFVIFLSIFQQNHIKNRFSHFPFLLDTPRFCGYNKYAKNKYRARERSVKGVIYKHFPIKVQKGRTYVWVKIFG